MLRCPKCDSLLDETGYCPQCGKPETSVQILTPQEREHFQGMTIQEDGAQRNTYSEYESANSRQQVYVRHIHISSGGSSGLFTKLIFLAFILMFVFIFLPVAFMFVAGGILGWFVLRLLKR